jgi:hypothetical protein
MTLLEQLTEAFPDQIERIKACAVQHSPSCVLDTDCEQNAGEALAGAFVWAETPEGYAYWANLARSKDWGH